MTQVLILTDLPPNVRAQYRDHLKHAFPQLKVDDVEHRSMVGPFIGETEILLTFSPVVDEAVFKAAPKLKWVQLLGVGTDKVADSPTLKNKLITNIKGIHGPPVSEAAIAAMFALDRNQPRVTRQQDQKKWERWPAQLLYGKTAGVFGVGAIGEALAPRLKALGMTVIGISSAVRETPHFDRMVHRDDLVKIAGELDYLVLITPLTAETRNIVNAKVFAAMKPTAFLVNVARGGVVDEAALMDALNAGKLAGAALDVFAEEPLRPDHPFWTMKNVIVSPHLGGFFADYEKNALPTIEHNMRCYLAGKTAEMKNIVQGK